MMSNSGDVNLSPSIAVENGDTLHYSPSAQNAQKPDVISAGDTLTAPEHEVPPIIASSNILQQTISQPFTPPQLQQPIQQGSIHGVPMGTTPTHRVNKNDALNYLDLVKTQFHDQPDVYNRFLEVMKDFKAHAINTATVIERVSALFEGHSNLIEGFNAFLPQESRIRLDRNIALASPSNTTDAQKSSIDYTLGHPSYPPYYSTLPPHSIPPRTGHYGQQISSGKAAAAQGPRTAPGWHEPAILAYSSPSYPTQSVVGHHHSSYSSHAAVSPGNPPTAYAASGGAGMGVSSGPSLSHPDTPITPAPARKPSVGMIQAVSYLRKIQERFFKQPEVYQSFVDILRSYQKEQRAIKDVYAQVASLFSTHQDLLDEFLQFIPDAQNAVTLHRQHPGPAPSSMSYPSRPVAYDSNNALYPSPVANRRGRAAIKRAISPSGDYQKKRSRHADGHNGCSVGELEFFDRVKRFLNNNEQAYSEFLKCLNWYTQDILKKSQLVGLVQSFIGRSEELFSWFKNFIGYHHHHHHTSSEQETSRRTDADGQSSGLVTDSYLLDLSSCKRIGSYRFLPKNYQQPACSGRNTLCYEVLNDLMVSCPSFTSEDSTFVSSKKNIYEEALFRCEDERYELDRLIDGAQATLMAFEPLLKKLQSINAKDAEKFTLNDTLSGGCHETTYKCLIYKIYGSKSDEILEALKKTPCVALPIVIKRLRQKDEEWRNAHREWNKIWRDVHYKNYYKALDNQSVNFKSSDKKVLSTKGLVNEIQAIYHEQLKGNAMIPLHLLPSSQGLSLLEKMMPAPPLPYVSGLDSGNASLPYQMEFKLGDRGVFADLIKVLLFFIVKSAIFNNAEKKSLWKFVVNFLPDFFSMKAKVEDTTPSEQETLKDADDIKSIFDKAMSEEGTFDVVLQCCPSEAKRSDFVNFSNHYNIIYGNDSIYSLFRLFQIAYHRLEQMKSISATCQDNPLHYHKKNYVATFLDMQKKQLSGSSFSSNYYSALLEMLTKLGDGSLDQNTFEEKIRLMFGAHSYLMFTYDRVLCSLLRHVIVILSDTSCEHMIALYDSYKRPSKGSIFSEYAYKVAARSLVSDEADTDGEMQSLFRIDSQKDVSEDVWWLKFRFIPPAKMSHSNATTTSADKWPHYIEQFVDVRYDPKVLSRKPPLLLLRALKRANPSRLEHMIVQFNLECKISVKTYKMYFVDHSEDFLYRVKRSRNQNTGSTDLDRCRDRSDRFHQWLKDKLSK